MVRTAERFSPAKAEARAKASCAWRERPRTARPDMINGATISGITASATPDSFGLDTIIMTMAPKNMNRLRRATEAEDPNAAFSWVVSEVRRDNSSPVLALS